MALNVLGTTLKECSCNPLTGYFRDGHCKTANIDHGTHIICAVITKDFLNFSKSKGNDLISPALNWNFPGLKPGDKWCLCISRWIEAEKAGKAPFIILEATHEKALNYLSIKKLRNYSHQ